MKYGMVWGLFHGWGHINESLCMIIIFVSAFVCGST
jgi:hypothetical protein